jgi:hypothetical protein
MRNTSSTPVIRQAAAMAGAMTCGPRWGGVARHTRRTRAVRAGTTVISTVEGYAARPPGTYRPTTSSGCTRSSRRPPSSTKPCGSCGAWNAAIRSAASSSACTTAGSQASARWFSSSSDRREDARATPSKRSVSARTASSPRVRTSSRMVATACSMRGSSRASSRSANTVARSAADSSESCRITRLRSGPGRTRLRRAAVGTPRG